MQNTHVTFNNGTRALSNRTVLLKPHTPLVFNSVVYKALQPMMEEWSGVTLTPSMTYGIRRYMRDAWLMLHVDRLNTHVVSAILQIDQVIYR